MAGAEGLASPSARGSPAAVPPSARTFRTTAVSFKVNAILQIWLGRKDSNLRMTGSKPAALPLGYAPVDLDLYWSGKIGRASCRERVEVWGGGGEVRKETSDIEQWR